MEDTGSSVSNKNQYQGIAAYWALGTYRLTIPIKSIKFTNPKKLEASVSERELFIVSWDWMNQWPIYLTSGFTEQTEWETHLLYPKSHQLPKTKETYKVEKGTVHLTEGVDSEHFTFLETGIRKQHSKPIKNLDEIPF